MKNVNTFPITARRENSFIVKAILDATERRFSEAFRAVKAVEDAEAVQNALKALDAAREEKNAEAVQNALAALAAARAPKEERAALAEAAEKYAFALIRFAWMRAESVERRAYDAGRRAAPLYEDFKDDAEAAKKKTRGGCNKVIARLKTETAPAARAYLLSDYVPATMEASINDRLSDSMDVMQEAILAVLETAEARQKNRAAAADIGAGVFDFEYESAADNLKKPACDVKRASRRAERYINSRAALALKDFRTLHYEAFSEEQDAKEAILLHIASGVYRALAVDSVMGAVTVQRINSIIAALNLTATERRRMIKYVSLASIQAVADSEHVTKTAAAKSIVSARAKVLAMLDDVAKRARESGNEARAEAMEKKQAELYAIVKNARARYDVHAAAPVYTTKYKTTLFPRALAEAVNDVTRAALAAAEAEALTETYTARKRRREAAARDRARAARLAAPEARAALDAAAAAKVDAARAEAAEAAAALAIVEAGALFSEDAEARRAAMEDARRAARTEDAEARRAAARAEAEAPALVFTYNAISEELDKARKEAARRAARAKCGKKARARAEAAAARLAEMESVYFRAAAEAVEARAAAFESAEARAEDEARRAAVREKNAAEAEARRAEAEAAARAAAAEAVEARAARIAALDAADARAAEAVEARRAALDAAAAKVYDSAAARRAALDAAQAALAEARAADKTAAARLDAAAARAALDEARAALDAAAAEAVEAQKELKKARTAEAEAAARAEKAKDVISRAALDEARAALDEARAEARRANDTEAEARRAAARAEAEAARAEAAEAAAALVRELLK